MAKRFIGHQIGGLVNPIVEVCDVDGVIQKVDMNKMLERVDFNAVLDRVDIDRQLERVDFDKVLDKIDVNRIIERSNLDAIIARSSAGVCNQMLDIVRTQVVYIDQFIQRFGRLACCNGEMYLPPKPGKKEEDKVKFPATRAELAVMIQHRYCGIFSRISGMIIDWLLIFAVFSIFILILEALVEFFTDESFKLHTTWTALAFFIWKWFYAVITIYMFRATLGMSIFGLIMVKTDGSRPGFIRIVLRQLVVVISSILFVLILFFFFFAWLRKDARTVFDMCFSTGVVYHWDARMAAIRTPKKPQTESQTIAFDDDEMAALRT